MSIESGEYRITNRLAGLAIELVEDNKIIGEYIDPGPSQTWIVKRTQGDKVHIVSKEDGKLVGFEGEPKEGVQIIARNTREAPKVWHIKPAAEDSPPNYKIRLHGTPWVIAFTRDNLQPGTPAILQREKVPEDISQVWGFTKRESCSQELSRFIL
ncbi:hypothetical protein EI94DRAFT_1810448 [Lactarius quietus]|nr:hypothetical protein EI94DRAFT_1810448 [Lactarius quietus]